MKGTIARGRWGAEDVQQRARLQQSAKDRAENLMIVDMLRNDLGRIARRGSVAVPDLFAIERYPTVWQMTSTVTAETGAPYTDIFRALFPAASITGAPKVRASAIVADAESTPRGLYTGAIGYLAPYRRARFNVAIRTAVIDPAHVTYGVGGGIVWDSTSRAEYQECLLKARIVTDAPPPFALLETLLWEAGTGYFLLAEHLQRLRATADYMDIAIDPARIRACLDDAVALPPAMRLRVRLLVDGAGIPSASASNLAPDSGAPVRVGLAREAIRRSNPFLYHKTTHRTWYDAAHAARPDCDDVILWNQDGEVTESTIANVVVECRGRHVTPPVRCGLLPGVMRQVLLARGEIEERVVTVAELRRARRVYLINSVRQWRDAVLVEPAPRA